MDQTEFWLWARPSRLKNGYGPHKVTEDRLWAGTTSRLTISYETDRTEPIQVCARQNKPITVYGPDRTDSIQFRTIRPKRSNSGQTEHACIGQLEQLHRKFVKTMSSVAPDPLSAAQICLVHTCLGSGDSSWVILA